MHVNKNIPFSTIIGVSEMASAKMASAIGVRIDDAGSILKFRIGFPFGENSAFFCQSVWLPGVGTEFPYRVRIVDRGVDCRDPVCRHHFRSPCVLWAFHLVLQLYNPLMTYVLDIFETPVTVTPQKEISKTFEILQKFPKNT